MNILEIATKAGMQVLVDARIGRETYHSVCGSLPALQRFADAVCAAMNEELPAAAASDEQRK
ncbi:MAG TPA: hypothetical protein VKS80_12515 [Trinickia sp.]|nr:hypothetical protein [Trinickia sp.]